MTIIVTTSGTELDSPVDPRFGRAAYFLVVDPVSSDYKAHPNPALDAAGGAGTQAAQFASSQGVEAVVSGAFGPNAFQALEAAGIVMSLLGPAATARQAVEAYRDGRLERATLPSRSGRRG